MLKPISIITIFVVMTGFLLIVGCKSSNLQNVKDKVELTSNAELNKKTDFDVKIPTGNEVGLKVKVLSRRKVKLTVSNNSSETVFLSYLPRSDNKYETFAVYQVERKDELTGEFKALPYGHSGPGTHPLEPGDFYRTTYFAQRKGIYRINITYSIDRKFEEEIINRSKSGWEPEMIDDEEFNKKYDLSIGKVTSEVFQL
jgi:hypothetical protein